MPSGDVNGAGGSGPTKQSGGGASRKRDRPKPETGRVRLAGAKASREDAKIDEASKESFPASDAPAWIWQAYETDDD